VPRETALARAIARRIAQTDPWEVDRQRWGRRIADMRHAPKKPQQLATRILQRVEIDHSPLKVVVGTEAGPIGQPWLTILIDYYSRLVVGFCLGFEPPSYAVIMEALRHAILPKTYLSQRYCLAQEAARTPGIARSTLSRWEVQGRITPVYGKRVTAHAGFSLYRREDLRRLVEATP